MIDSPEEKKEMAVEVEVAESEFSQAEAAVTEEEIEQDANEASEASEANEEESVQEAAEEEEKVGEDVEADKDEDS